MVFFFFFFLHVSFNHSCFMKTLFGGPCSAYLTSTRRGYPISHVRKADQWRWCSGRDCALLCSVGLFYKDGFLLLAWIPAWSLSFFYIFDPRSAISRGMLPALAKHASFQAKCVAFSVKCVTQLVPFVALLPDLFEEVIPGVFCWSTIFYIALLTSLDALPFGLVYYLPYSLS